MARNGSAPRAPPRTRPAKRRPRARPTEWEIASGASFGERSRRRVVTGHGGALLREHIAFAHGYERERGAERHDQTADPEPHHHGPDLHADRDAARRRRRHERQVAVAPWRGVDRGSADDLGPA